MNKETKDTLSRRDFVKGGIALAGTVFCFSGGAREAVARSNALGLPLLTEKSLNQKFAEARVAGALRKLASDIKPNPKGWLKNQYSLTDLQNRAINTIPETQWAEIKRILTFVEENRGASLIVDISETKVAETAAAVTSSLPCRAKIKVYSEALVGPTTVKAEAHLETA